MNKKEDKSKKAPEPKQEKKEAKDYDALWDKHLRLQAEFDNYRKRSHREKGEFVKFANEMLIMELLEILDNFERGVKSAEQKKDFNLLHQGVDMISKQLHSLLEAKGLKRIKAVGQEFDPHLHEAMEVVEEEGIDKSSIVEELQPGYTFNGRIIRTAKVKVKKGKDDKKEDKNVEEKKEEGGEKDE